MNFLTSIRDFIMHLPRKEMKKWSILYISICGAAIIAIIGYHMYADADLNSKIKQLNKSRQQLQQIFTDYEKTQSAKIKINELLSNNKNFNIQKYFQMISNQHQIAAQTSVNFQTEKLPNGYIQELLQISISSITTEKLCRLIDVFEKEAMVFVPLLEITSVPQTKKINVSMHLATFRLED